MADFGYGGGFGWLCFGLRAKLTQSADQGAISIHLRCHYVQLPSGRVFGTMTGTGGLWKAGNRNRDTDTDRHSTCFFWVSNTGPIAVRWQVSANLPKPSPAQPSQAKDMGKSDALTRQTAT